MNQHSSTVRGRIDLGRERVIRLAEAAREVPSGGRGKGVHVQTVYRWATKGCRGQILESVFIGGIRFTSLEALERFFGQLSRGSRGSAAGEIVTVPTMSYSTLAAAGITKSAARVSGARLVNAGIAEKEAGEE